MEVVGADDAGAAGVNHGFGTSCQFAMPTAGAHRAAQIVIDPFRQIDGVMILAATAGHCLQGPQHALVQIAPDRTGHRQWPLARVVGKKERPVLDARQRCDDLLRADDNGTKCSRALPSRPFILDAGMVMTLP